ncbi:MAG: chemotaxis protein CheW, partial [Lentisphaeraceae bacterium]|nr:chemotaxis protein CheW [Lentisphaeraceae bacterium]
TAIPQSNSFIQGVINLRGKIVTVLNLSKYFDLEYKPSDTDSIIIIDEDEECIGLLVSEVKDVIDIEPHLIEHTPAVPHELNPEYVKAVTEVDKELTAILNVREILKVEIKEVEEKG